MRRHKSINMLLFSHSDFISLYFSIVSRRECPREAYIEHVTSLRDYLVDFIQRSQPLFEIEQKRAEIQREFEKKHR